MQSEKYARLLEKLVTKTADHELPWKEGAYPNSFQVSFPHYSLLLKEEVPAEGFSLPPPDLKLSILNMSGKAIDEFYGFEIASEIEGRTYTLIMRELYRLVRQQVFGADKAVEEILSELGE